MKYQVGDVVIGKVSAIKSYGAFIIVDNAHTGLLHISEISYGYIQEVANVLCVDEQIKLKIISIDEETNKIIFSKKALYKNKRKTRKRERHIHQERIMETKQGFKFLKLMLPIWIDDYDGKENVKI